jgi:hypothetical protein
MRMALDNSRFEQMIADAMAAQQAGVFARTPVDSAALAAAQAISSSRPGSLRERLLIGAPIAACLAAVLGLAALWGGGTKRCVYHRAFGVPRSDAVTRWFSVKRGV